MVPSTLIDKLFQTLFECEELAKTNGGRGGDTKREPVGLPEAIASCMVRSTQPPLDLNKLRRHRNADATCFQAHPGLCVCDANATSIRSFHQSLRKALQTFKLDPVTARGEALFLFCGYRRKNDANRAQRRVQGGDVDNVSADEFEMAFLADEPERRKGLKVFTRCHFRVDDQRTFNFWWPRWPCADRTADA